MAFIEPMHRNKPNITYSIANALELHLSCTNPSILCASVSSDRAVVCLQVHFLYQFSLQFFLDIFSAVLYNNPALNTIKEYAPRLSNITTNLFQVGRQPLSTSMG